MTLPRFALPLALAAVALTGTGLARSAMPERRAVEAGRKIWFTRGCYQCHGAAGQGSIISGPALVPFTLPLDAMRHYVRNPTGVMPPYRQAALPDDDVVAVRAFLVSLPAPRDPATIPLLAPLLHAAGEPARPAAAPAGGAGKALFGRHCAMCHGAELQGGIGPTLRDEGSRHSVAEIQQILRAPPAPMPKLYPGTIKDADVAVIAAYVHGFGGAKGQ
jgi:ubiquinol-cytochrome c reductase cytochrome c subunit